MIATQMRLLGELGLTIALPDGKSVKPYVGEVLIGGFAGFAREKAKAGRAESERYKAAKEVIKKNK